MHSASPRRTKGGPALRGEWIVAVLLFAALMLASTPGLSGHGHDMHSHHMHAHDATAAPDTPGAQMDAAAVAPAPIVAVVAASDEHRHHPCGSHDAGCKRISSCVSCVSAIASTSAAMPLPYAVRALRKAPDAIILAGIPPVKLQRPPRSFS